MRDGGTWLRQALEAASASDVPRTEAVTAATGSKGRRSRPPTRLSPSPVGGRKRAGKRRPPPSASPQPAGSPPNAARTRRASRAPAAPTNQPARPEGPTEQPALPASRRRSRRGSGPASPTSRRMASPGARTQPASSAAERHTEVPRRAHRDDVIAQDGRRDVRSTVRSMRSTMRSTQESAHTSSREAQDRPYSASQQGNYLAEEDFSASSPPYTRAAEWSPQGLDDLPELSPTVQQRTPKATVWILGHSYVYWAARRASIRSYGRQLGFPESTVRARWRGIRGLLWQQILPEFLQLQGITTGPKVIVIHAGGNDMGMGKNADLIHSIRQDLERCSKFLRSCVLVWSEIIHRRVWRHARNPLAMEKCRKKLNMSVSAFVNTIGGVVVRHREMEQDGPHLLRDDGVHLNPIGLDIFNMNLQSGIETALLMLGHQSG
ncbi:hypothetical protein XENTR_v10008398 [Xenopus tropicalis]|nr:hypothetical protein XENTR_v10008398 [Xenopus tropicalis]